MAYICTVCKTPAQREGHCVLCGWAKTITISESQIGRASCRERV